MKKYLLFLTLLFSSIFTFAQNNVTFSSKIFPKIDKIQEFEMALKVHVQKYHTNDWKWNVFQVQSGPDYGGYMISEYPVSWDQVDKRGDLGSAHMADWNKNVLVHVREVGRMASYGEFKAELSTVALTDYADKIMVEYQISKPGKASAHRAMLETLKKVWVEGKESVAVYEQVANDEYISWGDEGQVFVDQVPPLFREQDAINVQYTPLVISWLDRLPSLIGAGENKGQAIAYFQNNAGTQGAALILVLNSWLSGRFPGATFPALP